MGETRVSKWFLATILRTMTDGKEWLMGIFIENFDLCNIAEHRKGVAPIPGKLIEKCMARNLAQKETVKISNFELVKIKPLSQVFVKIVDLTSERKNYVPAEYCRLYT